MNPRTLVTPVACRGRPIELAKTATGRRRFRKQILPLGELEYEGRTLRFDKPYLLGVQKAYEQRAFDHVPLQLANDQNAHNNNPELTRGLIDGLSFVEGRGLFMDVSTSKAGAQLLDDWPEIGVSVRLVEDLDERTPAALQHVLATWDPRITGMAGWDDAPTPENATDLSRARFGPVIDLSSTTYARLGRKGATVAPTQEDIAQAVQEGIAAAMAKLGGGAGAGTEPTPPAGEYVPPSDEELQRIADDWFGPDGADLQDDPPSADDPNAEPADTEVDQRQLVEASRRASDNAIELANSRLDEVERRNIDLVAERDRANWETERGRWIASGIPPHAVDLARGALEGNGHEIALSNGNTWDAGAQVREIFGTLVKTGGLVDMSRSVGTAHDGSDQTGEQAEIDRVAGHLIDGLVAPR